MLSDRAFEWLRDLTKNSNRSAVIPAARAAKMLDAVPTN
jgi:hypothetical protein